MFVDRRNHRAALRRAEESPACDPQDRWRPTGPPLRGERRIRGRRHRLAGADRCRRADVARDPQVTAVAAAMPLALVEPVESVDARPAAGPPGGWRRSGRRPRVRRIGSAGRRARHRDRPRPPAFAGMGNRSPAALHRRVRGQRPRSRNPLCGNRLGQDVDGTRIGVAQGIERALIGKVLREGGGTSATIVEAIQWALAEGANVVSMSLGSTSRATSDYLVRVRVNVRPATSLALAEYRLNINLFDAVADLVRAQGRFGRGASWSPPRQRERAPTSPSPSRRPRRGRHRVSGGDRAGRSGVHRRRLLQHGGRRERTGVVVISARAGGASWPGAVPAWPPLTSRAQRCCGPSGCSPRPGRSMPVPCWPRWSPGRPVGLRRRLHHR